MGCLGLISNGTNLKMILVDLIEEDFSSRSFDNIKALHALVKIVQTHYALTAPPAVSEEDFVVNHLDFFFKFRNKVSELESLASQQ